MNSPRWFVICIYFLILAPFLVLSFLIVRTSVFSSPNAPAVFLMMFFYGYLMALIPAYAAALAFWLLSRVYLFFWKRPAIGSFAGSFLGLTSGLFAASTFGLIFGGVGTAATLGPLSSFFVLCAAVGSVCGALAGQAPKSVTS